MATESAFDPLGKPETEDPKNQKKSRKPKRKRKPRVLTRAQKDKRNEYTRGWRRKAELKNPGRKESERLRLSKYKLTYDQMTPEQKAHAQRLREESRVRCKARDYLKKLLPYSSSDEANEADEATAPCVADDINMVADTPAVHYPVKVNRFKPSYLGIHFIDGPETRSTGVQTHISELTTTGVQTNASKLKTTGVQTNATVVTTTGVQTNASEFKTTGVQTNAPVVTTTGVQTNASEFTTTGVQTDTSILNTTGVQTDTSILNTTGVQTNATLLSTTGVQTVNEEKNVLEAPGPEPAGDSGYASTKGKILGPICQIASHVIDMTTQVVVDFSLISTPTMDKETANAKLENVKAVLHEMNDFLGELYTK